MEKQELYEAYRLELETVSPILISGGSAESEYGTGYIKHDNRVYIVQWSALQKYLLKYKKVDIEKIEEICKLICNPHLLGDNGQKKDINMRRILETAGINVLDDIEYIKKIASGVTILSDEEGIRKFICNAKGEAYIPGSSIKGALKNGYMGNRIYKNKFRDKSIKSKLCKNIENLAINKDTTKSFRKECNFLDKESVEKIKEQLAQLKQENEKLEKEYHRLKKRLPIEIGVVSKIKLNENESCNPAWVKRLNRKYEKLFFKKVYSNMANFDFFKGIKIFDSQKIDVFSGNMRVLSIQNGELKKKRIGNDAIQYYEGKFEIDITIDKRIINSFNTGFNLFDFMQEVYFYYNQVWKEEIQFYAKYCRDDEYKNVLYFYKEMEHKNLLRIGWGSGYLSTTLGTGFDDKTRKHIRNVFIQNHPSSIAPKSRKIIIDKDGLAKPFGWVRVVNCNKIS